MGAYVGWSCVTYLHTPLPVTVLVVLAASALLGIGIERVGLRPLAGSAQIAPLLATIGIGLILDQLLQILFTPDPRALPSSLPTWRVQVGAGTIGALAVLIAGVGVPRCSSASAATRASSCQPMAPQSPPRGPKSCASVPVGSGTVA